MQAEEVIKSLGVRITDDGNQGSSLTSCTFYNDLSDGFIKGGCGTSKICVRDDTQVVLECLRERGCMV